MRTTTEKTAALRRGTLERRTQLHVDGMTCENCVRHAREALENVPGVNSALVTLPNERDTVRWEPQASLPVPALIKALKQAGYAAHPLIESTVPGAESECHSAGWKLNLWIGVVGMLALMIGEWVFHLEHEVWFRRTAFAISTLVQIFGGAPFYRGAWNQLRVGSSNMDTLVVLGSTTAYLYSASILLSGSGGHLYFMEAAAIISLISGGHWLEARVTGHASRALQRP